MEKRMGAWILSVICIVVLAVMIYGGQKLGGEGPPAKGSGEKASPSSGSAGSGSSAAPSQSQPAPLPSDAKEMEEAEFTVFKLGKADAILIESGGRAMIIDTGEKGDGSKIMAVLNDRGIQKVDWLILTHLDKDHIGGAARIIEGVKIDGLIQSNNEEASDAYEAYTKACEKKGLAPQRLTKPLSFQLADASVRLLPAAKKQYEEDNDYSIITEITLGSRRFLFAGDAEEERLKEYLSGDVKPFDFVKMPHHGRKNPLSAAFIRAVLPEYAVITCSKKNPPDSSVVRLLEQAGAKVFLTSGGTITAVSDGRTLAVKQTK